MPSTKHKEFTPTYEKLAKSSGGERAVCGPLAVAVVTNLPMILVLDIFESEGRKRGQRTSLDQIERVLAKLGYELRVIPSENFIERYGPAHQHLKCVTTHHPDRFPEVWRDGNTYLLEQSCHISAVVDGVLHDHMRGRSGRVHTVFQVVKK